MRAELKAYRFTMGIVRRVYERNSRFNFSRGNVLAELAISVNALKRLTMQVRELLHLRNKRSPSARAAMPAIGATRE
jgi:hypothetical protein